MKLLKEKQIYQILLELNKIGINEYNEGIEKEILKDEFKEGLDWILNKKIEKKINTFKNNNNIYIDELVELKYIKKIGYEQTYPTYYPILTNKGKIFLENYKKDTLFYNINLITIMSILTLIVTIIGVFYTILSYYK